MASLRGRMTGRAASGSWENYSMADEHMSIANLFLKNFINMVSCL
jgi:hypothetical protein